MVLRWDLEDLITALSQFPGLKVIGRTSAFQFRDSKEDIRSIGAKLGVAHLLEGSVRRSGEMVRVSAELIDTADGSTQWSERYDRPYKDLFALQDEITHAVAGALRAKLVPGEHVRRQSDGRRGSLEATTHAAGQFYEARRTGVIFARPSGYTVTGSIRTTRCGVRSRRHGAPLGQYPDTVPSGLAPRKAHDGRLPHSLWRGPLPRTRPWNMLNNADLTGGGGGGVSPRAGTARTMAGRSLSRDQLATLGRSGAAVELTAGARLHPLVANSYSSQDISGRSTASTRPSVQSGRPSSCSRALPRIMQYWR